MLDGLRRYIATAETAKHRFFIFLDADILPDSKLIAIALDDAEHLAILSSRIHVAWALAAGGRLGDGNDPATTSPAASTPSPSPTPTTPTRARLRDLGERLDAHRKRQQAAHPGLTLTQMYNVLEKLRAGEPIEGRDREIYDDGLVGILRQLHDEIDAETARAYGWPADLSDDEILAPPRRAQPRARRRGGAGPRPLAPPRVPEPDRPRRRPRRRGRARPRRGRRGGRREARLAARRCPSRWRRCARRLQAAGEAGPADIARRFRRARADTVSAAPRNPRRPRPRPRHRRRPLRRLTRRTGRALTFPLHRISGASVVHVLCIMCASNKPPLTIAIAPRSAPRVTLPSPGPDYRPSADRPLDHPREQRLALRLGEPADLASRPASTSSAKPCTMLQQPIDVGHRAGVLERRRRRAAARSPSVSTRNAASPASASSGVPGRVRSEPNISRKSAGAPSAKSR